VACKSILEIEILVHYVLSYNKRLLFIIQPQEFIAKTERERTELKSSLLLERFKVYVRSGVQTQESRTPPLRLLHISLANPEEAISHMQ
jgi:hypothetical protein